MKKVLRIVTVCCAGAALMSHDAYGMDPQRFTQLSELSKLYGELDGKKLVPQIMVAVMGSILSAECDALLNTESLQQVKGWGKHGYWTLFPSGSVDLSKRIPSFLLRRAGLIADPLMAPFLELKRSKRFNLVREIASDVFKAARSLLNECRDDDRKEMLMGICCAFSETLLNIDGYYGYLHRSILVEALAHGCDVYRMGSLQSIELSVLSELYKIIDEKMFVLGELNKALGVFKLYGYRFENKEQILPKFFHLSTVVNRAQKSALDAEIECDELIVTAMKNVLSIECDSLLGAGFLEQVKVWGEHGYLAQAHYFNNDERRMIPHFLLERVRLIANLLELDGNVCSELNRKIVGDVFKATRFLLDECQDDDRKEMLTGICCAFSETLLKMGGCCGYLHPNILVELLAYGYENPFLRKIIPVILSEAEVGGATSWGGYSACVLNHGSSDMYLATCLRHMIFSRDEEFEEDGTTLKEQYEPIIRAWIEQSRGVPSYEKWNRLISLAALENEEIIDGLQEVMNEIRSMHSAKGHKDIQFPVVDSFASFLYFPTDV